MDRLTHSERALAAALAALAGLVDVTGFLRLGGYFVSFMSGNTTRAAAGLTYNPTDAAIAGGLILAFVLGVIAGSLVGHAVGARRRPVVLALVGACLVLAGAADAAAWLAGTGAALAFAMGAMNAVFEQAGDVRFGLTYMTGTLVKVGQRLAAKLRGDDTRAWSPFFLQWTALASGAVLGGLLHPVLGFSAIWLAASACILLALTLQLRKPQA